MDDEFSQEKVRLAQLTNKCEDKDLEYFVREAGDILGISEKVKNRGEPKAILKYILDQIVNVEFDLDKLQEDEFGMNDGVVWSVLVV